MDGNAIAEITVTGDPIPTKFDPAEEKMIREINRLTSLPLAQIIKRGMRFALPKFVSGEVSILTLEPAKVGAELQPLHGNGKEHASAS